MTKMPISELPSNQPARNGVGQLQDGSQDGRSRTGTPNGDESLDVLKNPSSIQSMLRNTTETGNVGQFSIRPSRVPTSLPRPLKARPTPGKQRQPGAYYDRSEDSNGRHTQFHRRQETTASNGSEFQNQIPRPHRGPARSPSVEDYHSYTTTKSSYASQGPIPHHLHINGGHGGPGGPQNIRPRSPFAYPTRLKRPGYRPSSPALSELNRQDRSQTSLHRRPSFRTNSPSSLHTNGTFSPWRKGINRSDPLLRYYPQSTVPLSGRAPSPSPITHPVTPKRSPSLKSITSSKIGRHATPNSSWLNARSSTHSPVFYDYTEDFGEQRMEQQDYSHYVGITTGTLAENPVPETATTTYYELDTSVDTTSETGLTSENSFAKLKMQAADNRFDQTTSQFEINDQSSIQALHKDLSEVPELPEGDISNAEADVAPAKHDSGQLDQESQYPFPKQASPSMTTAECLKQPPDQEHPPQILLQVENTQDLSQILESPHRHLASSLDSDCPAHPAPPTTSEREDHSPYDSAAKSGAVPPPSAVELPTAKSEPDEEPTSESRSSIQFLRASSFEDHSVREHTVTEIISPTPERSMTSPTTVSRFSKILSINDDLLDLDELANRIKGKDRTDSPMQAIMDSKARTTRMESPWRKRSVQLREIATRQNAADYALVEVSDSEDEPELTQGLRQTFCKPDELPLGSQTTSPPITLPSQSVHRGYPGPLSIRRSPAVRRSISGVGKVRDPQAAYPDQGLGSAEENATHTAPTGQPERSSLVRLDTDQDLESTRKRSIQSSSTPDIESRPTELPPPDKELPSLPHELPAVVSLSPPVAPRLLSLPFSFTPLIQRMSEDDTASVAELEAVTSSYLDQSERIHEDGGNAAPITATELSPSRSSIGSLPNSRPWNLDTSYPWSDQQPKLEVTMPEQTEDPNRSTASLPRFRLNVQRASSTTQSTGKITKYPQPSDASSSLFASSHDIFQGTAFGPRRYPNLSVLPGQINSSHDVIRSSPNQTLFVESFETQSPRITLVPPSPGFEARSFFSDDSSQVPPKGTIRKRISALRNMRSRGASADEPRGYDQGLLSSALGRSGASGRTSRQSENTAITAGASSYISQTKRARLKLVGKLRSWWQRGEDRVREWRWRRRYNGAVGRSLSADLYTGV